MVLENRVCGQVSLGNKGPEGHNCLAFNIMLRTSFLWNMVYFWKEKPTHGIEHLVNILMMFNNAEYLFLILKYLGKWKNYGFAFIFQKIASILFSFCI